MIVANQISKEYHVREVSSTMRDFLIPKYKTIRAVDDISFTVDDGEVVGYIGPNGAGKSTTIKILTGILTPTAGTVEINGLDPHRNRKKCVRNLGAMFGQKTQLWWDLPLKDSYQILKSMYGVSDSEFHENMKLFNEVLEIDQFYNSTVRQLSLGQRVRGDLAAVFLHNPSVVLLDEPTIGIDILAKDKIRAFIREINKRRQTTVLLTTHDMSDIDALCDRIILINGGHLTYDGSLVNLKSTYGIERTLSVTFEQDYPDFALAGARLAESKPFYKKYMFDISTSPATLIEEIVKAHKIKDLTVNEPDLEGIIKKLYNNSSTENHN